MRTFHIGGAAARGKIEQSSLEARNDGHVRIRNANIAKKSDGTIVMNRHGEIVLVDDTGREREHHRLVYGAILRVNEGDKVKPGQLLAEWDAFAMPILSEVGGRVVEDQLCKFLDHRFILNISFIHSNNYNQIFYIVNFRKIYHR